MTTARENTARENAARENAARENAARQNTDARSGREILRITDLHVSVAGKEIVQGLSLTVRAGEKHAIMGPNGSGKSTLANALMGHPSYEVTAGRVELLGADITAMPPDERARRGLFLAFQYPVAVPGVTVAGFLRMAVKSRLPKGAPETDHPELRNFRKTLTEGFNLLQMDRSFATRYLNEGFSGGEKKRLEILQMAILKPRMAVLDETDSGLDIDALRVVSAGVNTVCGPDTGALVVTHYQRLLEYIKPDFVHVLMHGRIVKSGGPEFALELEKTGYDPLEREFGGAPS
jgi:Fe-S cluster assembly ATP-binding protein